MKNEINRALVAKKKFSKFSLTLLAGFLLTFAFPSDAWAFDHGTHYGKVTVTKTGEGSVYIGTTDTAKEGKNEETWNCEGEENKDSKTYYLFATPDADAHYYFEGWYLDGTNKGTARPYAASHKAEGGSNSPSTFDYTAKFELLPKFYFAAGAEVDPAGNGTGKVAVAYTSTEPAAGSFSASPVFDKTDVWAETKDDGSKEATAYYFAKADVGMTFMGWYDKDGVQKTTNTTYSVSQTSTTTKEDNATPEVYYARFRDPSIKFEPAIELAGQDGATELTLKIEETQVVSFVNVDDAVLSTLNAPTINIVNRVDVGSDPIVIWDANAKTLTANRAGTATITFSHPVTGDFNAADFTFTILVEKITPEFSWKTSALLDGQTYSLTDLVETPSDGAWNIVSSKESVFASISQAGTQSATAHVGSVTLTFSQGMSYKYNAISADSKTFKVYTNEGFATYLVGSTLYTDLGVAVSEASKLSKNKYVIVNSDGALIPGNYTIPSGVSVIVPHKDGSSLQTKPEVVTTAATLTAYRTWKILEGTNITVNGIICVCGNIMSANGGSPSGYPTGGVGVIDMSTGGHIDVASGGTLYCWGLVRGQGYLDGNNTKNVGTITAKNNSLIREYYSVGDWGGGSLTKALNDAKSSFRVYPFQSYFVQNIEVPVRFEYGSKEQLYLNVYGGGGKNEADAIYFIGTQTGVLFYINSAQGAVTKWYDATTDHMVVELEGDTRLDNLKIVVMGYTINANEFDLPILNNMHIKLKNCDLTLSSPVMMQPSSIFEVTKGSSLTLNTNLFVYDADQWDKFVMGKYFRPVHTILTPHVGRGDGSTNTLSDAQLIVDGTLMIGTKGALYTTAGGADVMGHNGGHVIWNRSLPTSGKICGYNGGTAVNGSSLTASLKDEYKVTNTCDAGNLHNENDSYTASVGNTTFDNLHGRWFTHAAATTLDANNMYTFTFIGGTSQCFYSPDKTGLTAGYKWVDLKETDNAHTCGSTKTFVGTDDNLYTFKNGEWLQLVQIAGGTTYSGSDDNLYQFLSCDWVSLGEIGDDCMYTVEGVKKAVVGSELIALTHDEYDEVFVDASGNYYMLFDGCVWQHATKVDGVYGAYTVLDNDYIWLNNSWTEAVRDGDNYYTTDDQNLNHYYEYDGSIFAWVPVKDKVLITTATGDEMGFRNWDDAMLYVSQFNNPTVTLLADVATNNPYTMVANAKTTDVTIDLNDHVLDANIGSQTFFLKLNNSKVTLTITDNSDRQRGELKVTCSAAKRVDAINVTAGKVVMEAGKVSIHNANNTTSGNAAAIYAAAGQSVTMNGGELEAISTRYAYGIYSASSAALASTSVVTVNGGTINATAKDYAYGILSYGIINMNDGIINATTTTVNGVAASSYAYGIYAHASANATEANAYRSVLTMKGGTINSNSGNQYAYGVYAHAAATTCTSAKDGTYSNKAAAHMDISGGTINATAVGAYAYAVNPYGCFNSNTDNYSEANQVPHTIKNVTINAKGNSNAYGILVSATIADYSAGILYGNVIVDNVNIHAETTGSTTAYGVYVSAVGKWLNRASYHNISAANRKTWYVPAGNASDGDLTHEAINGTESNTYKYQIGNYTCGAKCVINGGTFYAKSVSTTAAGVYVHGAASPGDNSWGYGELTINGGTFTGETGTDTGMGIYNLGNTTINGGTFSAITGTTTAYGAYALTGTLNLEGGTYNATSNGSTAYGVSAGATINTDNTTRNHGTVNVREGVVVNARSLTSSTVFGAYAQASAQELTEAKYDARSTSNKGQYCLVDAEGNLLKEALNATTNDGAKANFYKYQIGQYFEGGIVNIYGGTFNATANTSTAAGVAAHMSNITRTTEIGRHGTARGTVNVYNGTFNVECETSSTAMGVRSYGIVNVEGGTFNMTPKTTNAEGVRVYDGKTTINGGTFNINATSNTAYGVYTTPDWDANYAFGYSGEILVNGGTFNVKTYGGDTSYGAYSTGGTKNMKGAKVTGDVAKDYAVAGSITINGGEFIMTPSTGKNAYGMMVAAPSVLNAAKAYARGTITGGFFKMVATTNACATGANATEDEEGVPQLQVKGGHFSSKSNLETTAPNNYVRDPYKVIDCIHPDYKTDYPFEVAEVCTITFKDDEDNTLWSGKQPKGTVAIYPLTNGVPEKAATADNSFEFISWDTPLTEITEDATYTASFNAVAKKYMVTWQDETGKEIDHMEWASGQTPTHDDPIKTGYTFTGWTPEISAVAGADQTYRATFKINTYTIRFEDEDGTLLNEQVVNYGVKPTAPATPTKEGYSFSKWNPGVLAATEDITYTASYLLDIASVTTTAGKTTKYSTFAAALKGANAAENSTLVLLQDQVGLGVQTVTQSFTLDLNGHTLASATTKFITLNTAGKTLTIDDSQGGGRIELVANLDGEAYAVFINNGTVVLNKGTIHGENVHATAADTRKGIGVRIETANGKFIMYGGRVEGQSKQIGTGIYAVGPVEVYGGEITGTARSKARAICSKAANLIVNNAYLEATTTTGTGAYGIYSDTSTPVFTIDNVTINAAAATTDAYGINLYSGNKGTISNVKIQATTAPIDADATNALSITSGFFDKETNLAKYIGTKNLVALTTEPEKAEGYNYKIVDAAYQITFKAEDGTVLQQTNVEAGVQPVFMGEEPTKPSNPKTSYEFAGWSDGVNTYAASEIPVVNAKAIYTATFIEHGVEYPITFSNIDGKGGTHVQMVEYGMLPVYNGPEPYMSGNVDNVAYIFNGWTPALTEVTEPTTYETTFRLEIAVDVTFHANGRGTDPVALKVAKGAAIERPADQLVDCQHIEGWYTEAGCINEWNFASDLADETDIDLYAKWATKTYTITWLDEFGDEIDQTTVNCGAVPTHADLYKLPTAAYSYDWKGWNKTLVAATADATYKSLGFKQVAKRYAITFVTGQGATVIAPIEQEVGSAITKPADPTRTGYTFAGWDKEIPATMPAEDMTITANWTINQYTITFDTKGGSEVTAITQDYNTAITAPANPTKTGYTFAGWTPAVPATMPAENMTITANWTAVPTTAKYTVKHYKLHIKNGEKFSEPFKTDESEVEIGSEVTPEFEKIEGYDPPAKDTTITISANPEENVVVYEYSISETNKLEVDEGNTKTITEPTEAYTVVLAPGKTMNITGKGSVTAQNLVLQSVPGSNEGANLATTSNLEILGDVCIEIKMNSTGTMNDKLYYCFSVPFNVNVNGGVERLNETNGNWESAVLNKNYLVYTYSESDRAAKGPQDSNWTLFKGTQFAPGVFYLCAFDNSNYNRYRFYAADKDLDNKENIAVSNSKTGSEDGGWNGVANNGLTDNQLSGEFEYIQTLNSVENCFNAVDASSNPLAIGNAAMVQVPESGSVIVGKTPSAVAARRMGETASTEFINVRLYKENQDKHVDQIFIRASEDAAEQYVAGIDLSKATMGTPKVARLWVNDYDLQLVANEALMTNDQATFSLGMSAPANGEYIIALNEVPNNATIYLTENGSAIWNLNIAPAPISLSKGTENSYGLRLVRKINNVVTGFDEAVLNGNVQKVILNDHLYIIRDGKVYSAHGHVIK